MARTAGKQKNAPELQFYQKLVLNRYLLSQFGADDFQALSVNLKDPSLEQIDGEGVTGFYKQLVAQISGHCAVSDEKLAQYDLNIVSYLSKINEKREDKIFLKYFQYLALLFTEYYLDEYFNDRQSLLTGLNTFVAGFNEQYPNDSVDTYKENDLNKIAFWSATGSGKTLLMHINYCQYIHYSEGKMSDDATFILLTPKEGLSLQHIEDFKTDGISSAVYDKNTRRELATKNEISVLENTKLDKKDGDKTVAVSRFGKKNVVFVDEGHRGASGDKWYLYRNMLCEEGFSFEYSATFGQAVKASGKNDLLQEYAKCIIFDYSYKFFHRDGYGKDYNILNLQDDSDDYKRLEYLTACLLTYYQQKKLYLGKSKEFAPFNIENPLLVFVGASVNAVRTENKRKVSDIVDILLFIRSFVTDQKNSIANIEHVLSGNTGLLDGQNRDVFRNTFPYLTQEGLAPTALYADVLKTVFNCNTVGATLHIENLKGVSGEIRLRLGDNDPFGVINVGDDSALLSLCTNNGFHTDAIDFSESLFQGITKPGSTINLLLGSKKFTEGWNCWRVSTMGLMNVGRSEGSEIIQLFGRGVRLKGYGMSLKRSSFYLKDYPDVKIPKHMGILETLNIFGVRADYMKQFKEFLDAEGVPSNKEQPIILKLPVIRNRRYKKSGLYSLRIKDDLDFKKDAAKPFLRFADSIHIVLDCYAKVQFQTSQKRTIGEVTKNEAKLRPEDLAFLDYNSIYLQMQEYKNAKARYNVNISKMDIIDLLNNPSWYTLLIPEEELGVHSFKDYKRFEKIAVALLVKYFDKYYYTEKSRWETPLLHLVPMDDDNENFFNEEKNKYTISISNADEENEMVIWLRQIIGEVNVAKENNQLINFVKSYGDISVIGFPSHLYSPLLYLAKNNIEINISPVPLNESERKFIIDLRDYASRNKDRFDGKELYIIRNKSKKGIGFFENSGFYPDFIMWLIAEGKQYITFIDPHGMGRESIKSEKVTLHTRIKDAIQNTLSDPKVVLNSFILSPTPHSSLIENYIPVSDWNRENVLFMDDNSYISTIFSLLK